MASFAIEEFVGDGALSGLIPKFVAAGWDDVPTLKMININDMDFLNFTQQQKDAMELRTHLHNRSLMQYADKMEASKIKLPNLLTMTTNSLSSQFTMKKSHVSRFVLRENNANETGDGIELDSNRTNLHSLKSHLKLNPNYDSSTARALLDLRLREGHVFKGIVASKPADPRLCGCVQPPLIVDEVASHSSIANISVQKLTPEYKVGVQRLLVSKAPPMKASDLWSEKGTILLCIRRPGCIMCRAEAHQLYSRKPIFDALGFQLVAVLHEQLESEVKEFWPRYWGGFVVVDQTMGFFKALGGGKLLKDMFLTGFLLNSRAMANYKAAKATGLDHNFRGEGGIKGGMFIIRGGRGGVAYQFIERNFGDWAPIGEVIEICTRIQVLFSDPCFEKFLGEVYEHKKGRSYPIGHTEPNINSYSSYHINMPCIHI